MLVFHSKVYISLFFCELELCFWYSLCVDCLQALCCERGLSKGTGGDEETLDLCKMEIVVIHPSYVVLKSSEQQPSNAKAVLFFLYTSVSRLQRGRKKKMDNPIRKSCFFSIGSASQ